jgi:hypothetical protein
MLKRGKKIKKIKLIKRLVKRLVKGLIKRLVKD